ncbi:cobaltochelatase subunit CobN [Aestuariibius insulae]|uniref:cobaltochelatase subunit CobN n=1 Tax=Aestuariibius insulae TaxID=2058287 RepID=UPI00345EEC89
MHLIAATPGAIEDGTDPVDLGQTPADLVVISAADTELAALSDAGQHLGGSPTLRLANLAHLRHPMSVDLHLDQCATRSRLVVIRLLGGRGYWPYGTDQYAARLAEAGVPLALLPGDDKPDTELRALSTVPGDAYDRLWSYLVEGGPENAANLLRYASHLLNQTEAPPEAKPLLRAGAYWPGTGPTDLTEIRTHWHPGAPIVPIVFYRALLQGAGLHPINRLTKTLLQEGQNPLPIFAASLKDPLSQATLARLFAEAPPDAILNTTAFATGTPDAPADTNPLNTNDAPVFQVVLSSGTEDAWSGGLSGLSARDIAMHVALPEVDGRILTRAISFKSEAYHDEATQAPIATYRARGDRVSFTAKLAANWTRLRRTEPADRKVALILANYPNKDGRLANGVGLDTPAATALTLRHLTAQGYAIENAPADGKALMDQLLAGPTNWLTDRAERDGGETLPLATYKHHYAQLPLTLREQIETRWGQPENDPFLVSPETPDACSEKAPAQKTGHQKPSSDHQTHPLGKLSSDIIAEAFLPEDNPSLILPKIPSSKTSPHSGDQSPAFALSIHRFGNATVCLQPARGYNIDPEDTYHSPDLVPPHNYLAFYIWLRHHWGAHALVHLGKHGNLEWLPGKALALSETCWPEAILGPTPHIYPFIVNDPGEGSQAKRRTSAVIVDHLTPPLTRAETYGPLRDLEALVDEYYEAASLDPRRADHLRTQILEISQTTGIAEDSGAGDDLTKLDAWLCELKEAQIRDGLHIFGQSAEGPQARDLTIALARLPRGDGKDGNASLLRALAVDLDLNFDPLDCDMAAPWTGPRPPILDANGWRSHGDTVERLEDLSIRLLEGKTDAPGPASKAVLETITRHIRPTVAACGPAELHGLTEALNGKAIPPGPSGAPTRGRLDTLPTGRNFYSVDTRAVPTPTAWALGWKSANLLIERHLQDHGDWPRALLLTAWGTANMRTGGDDIAQALALMGVKPTWDSANRRVTGFEVLPQGVLGRPRVDVTLRISGFFRDAFPGLVALVDSAAKAIMALDEPDHLNHAAARARSEGATPRVFGSKPGAYGAGLQALIDERLWTEQKDLADAYLDWSGYAYEAGQEGKRDRTGFETRLSQAEAIVQNQDNREHDILDSDDYYQFEGGAAAAITHLQGQSRPIYHNDHSRPERPVIRTLDEEIARVLRSRVINPKWIEGARRHGYKGAFEIAATVDYLFAFAATTGAVKNHHFDLVEAAFLEDEDTRQFIQEENPSALTEIAERLHEAIERGLWIPKSNSARARIDQIRTS